MKVVSHFLATLLVALVIGGSVHAQVTDQLTAAEYSIFAFYTDNTSPVNQVNTRKDSDTQNSGDSIFMGDGVSVSGSFGEGKASAIAHASIGSIGVSLSMSAVSKTFVQFAGFGDAGGFADASWRDLSIFQTPGGTPGQRFIATGALQPDLNHLEIKGSASSGSHAFLNLIIKNFGNHTSLPASPYGGNLWGSFNSDAFVDTQYPPALILFEQEYIVGEPVAHGFSVKLEGSISAVTPGAAEVSGEFSNSLEWGGILSVRDAVTGVEVHDYTITSASGFDYTKSFDQQVPEPSCTIMLIVGLSFFAPRWQRRDGKVKAKNGSRCIQ